MLQGGLRPLRESRTTRAQVHGGIVYGLSAALKGEITVANGRVEQSNSDDYDLLRINETPQTEVHVGRLPIRAEELA